MTVLRSLALRATAALAALLCCAGPTRADTYDAYIASGLYGNLVQYDVPEIGDICCGPTAVTNSLTYLQNTQPALYGTSLVPPQEQDFDGSGLADFYDDMIATALTLSADAYMHLRDSGGYTTDAIWGKAQYMEERAPGATIFAAQTPLWVPPTHPQPDWVDLRPPKWRFLYNALNAGAGIELGMNFDSGGGHWVSVNGLSWVDADDDGTIQETEDAALYFVDPLTGQEGTMTIWNDSGWLRSDYYGGSMVIATMSATAVPEPATLFLLVLIGALARARA